MERRKSIDAGTKGLELPLVNMKRRGSVGFGAPENEKGFKGKITNEQDLVGQEKKKGSTLKLESKLENLKETIKAQEDQDPKLAAKLGRLSNNIDAVIDKTRTAREELTRMTEITSELKAQTEIQQVECQNLESDQQRIRDDIESVTRRMEILLAEKKRVEERLASMKDQNNKLEDFLEVWF